MTEETRNKIVAGVFTIGMGIISACHWSYVTTIEAYAKDMGVVNTKLNHIEASIKDIKSDVTSLKKEDDRQSKAIRETFGYVLPTIPEEKKQEFINRYNLISSSPEEKLKNKPKKSMVQPVPYKD